MPRSGSVWLIFLGVFFAGVVAGGFVSMRFVKPAQERRGPDDVALRIMERYRDRLQLTKEQCAAVQPHVDRAAAEMHRIRGLTAEAMQQLEQAISKELTAPQLDTLEQMQVEQRERWKKWMEKREQERRAAAGGAIHADPDEHDKPDGSASPTPKPQP